MKINEFIENDETGINFDIVDDTIVFMRNDPMFYRKNYFPAITKMADAHHNGDSYEVESILGPIVDLAMDNYCKRYKIARSPSEIYTTDDRQNILNMIATEELEEIKKGEYK
jgi:hypothetical protein